MGKSPFLEISEERVVQSSVFDGAIIISV